MHMWPCPVFAYYHSVIPYCYQHTILYSLPLLFTSLYSSPIEGALISPISIFLYIFLTLHVNPPLITYCPSLTVTQTFRVSSVSPNQQTALPSPFLLVWANSSLPELQYRHQNPFTFTVLIVESVNLLFLLRDFQIQGQRQFKMGTKQVQSKLMYPN